MILLNKTVSCGTTPITFRKDFWVTWDKIHRRHKRYFWSDKHAKSLSTRARFQRFRPRSHTRIGIFLPLVHTCPRYTKRRLLNTLSWKLIFLKRGKIILFVWTDENGILIVKRRQGFVISMRDNSACARLQSRWRPASWFSSVLLNRQIRS